MERVLVLYATRHGQAKKIAERAAEQLRSQRGLQVDVLDVGTQRVHDHGLGQRELRAAAGHVQLEHGVAALLADDRGELQRRQREVDGVGPAGGTRHCDPRRRIAEPLRAGGKSSPEGEPCGFGVRRRFEPCQRVSGYRG